MFASWPARNFLPSRNLLVISCPDLLSGQAGEAYAVLPLAEKLGKNA